MATFNELRNIIKNGFRDYDGDILEEAIEAIDDLEKQTSRLAAENRNLNDATIQRGVLINDLECIDFGIGKLYFSIEKESAITIQELMAAINECACIVPVYVITSAIKSKLLI